MVLFAANLEPDKVYTKPVILDSLRIIIDVEQHKVPIDEVMVRMLLKNLGTMNRYFAENATPWPMKVVVKQEFDRAQLTDAVRGQIKDAQ